MLSGRVVLGPERGEPGWYLVENVDGTVCVVEFNELWGLIQDAGYPSIQDWADVAAPARRR